MGSVVPGFAGDLTERRLRRDVGDLDVRPGSPGGAGYDDQVVEVLRDSVALLSDVVDGYFDDIADVEGVGILGPGSLPDHDRPACTACLADEDEGPVLLVDVGIGPAALGTDDVGLSVVPDLLVDVVGVDLRFENYPAVLEGTGGSELLQQVLEEVLGIPPDLVGDVDEVPEDGDLSFLDDVQLGQLEPLVGLDGLGELLFSPVEHCQVIVRVHVVAFYNLLYK